MEPADLDTLCLGLTLEEVVHPLQWKQRGWEVCGLSSLYFDSEQPCLSVECCLAVGNGPVEIHVDVAPVLSHKT